MINTPSDADVNDVVQQELNEYLNGAYADYSGAKDQLRCFARAVLAKWGAQQPVVRDPLSAEHLEAAVEAWFSNSKYSSFQERMRLAIEAAHGIKQNGGKDAE